MINTAPKRLASLDFEEVWSEAMPVPDGTVSTADRWHSIWSYLLDVRGSVALSNAAVGAVAASNAAVGAVAVTDA